MGEPGEDRHGGLFIEKIGLVQKRDILARFRKRGRFHVDVDAEGLADRNLGVWFLDMVRGLPLIDVCCRHGLFQCCWNELTA